MKNSVKSQWGGRRETAKSIGRSVGTRQVSNKLLSKVTYNEVPAQWFSQAGGLGQIAGADYIIAHESACQSDTVGQIYLAALSSKRSRFTEATIR